MKKFLNLYSQLFKEGLDISADTLNAINNPNHQENIPFKFDIDFNQDQITSLIKVAPPDSFYANKYDFRNNNQGTFFAAYRIRDNILASGIGEPPREHQISPNISPYNIRTSIYHWFKKQPFYWKDEDFPEALTGSSHGHRGGRRQYNLRIDQQTQHVYNVLINRAARSYVTENKEFNKTFTTFVITPESKSQTENQGGHARDIRTQINNALALPPRRSRNLEIVKKSRKDIFIELCNHNNNELILIYNAEAEVPLDNINNNTPYNVIINYMTLIRNLANNNVVLRTHILDIIQHLYIDQTSPAQNTINLRSILYNSFFNVGHEIDQQCLDEKSSSAAWARLGPNDVTADDTFYTNYYHNFNLNAVDTRRPINLLFVDDNAYYGSTVYELTRTVVNTFVNAGFRKNKIFIHWFVLLLPTGTKMPGITGERNAARVERNNAEFDRKVNTAQDFCLKTLEPYFINAAQRDIYFNALKDRFNINPDAEGYGLDINQLERVLARINDKIIEYIRSNPRSVIANNKRRVLNKLLTYKKNKVNSIHELDVNAFMNACIADIK